MSFWWHKRDKSGKRYLWQIDVEPLIIFLVIGLLAALVVPRFFARHKTQVKPLDNVYSIDSQGFAGFEKCAISAKLSATTKRLITDGKPIKKEENTLTYEIRSKVMGFPIKAIMLGVCDDGSQDCGWGSFLAVVIAKPLKEARNQLKTKTGFDFTEEIRDKESEVTLRPVLAASNNSNESVLFCDPGIL